VDEGWITAETQRTRKGTRERDGTGGPGAQRTEERKHDLRGRCHRVCRARHHSSGQQPCSAPSLLLGWGEGCGSFPAPSHPHNKTPLPDRERGGAPGARWADATGCGPSLGAGEPPSVSRPLDSIPLKGSSAHPCRAHGLRGTLRWPRLKASPRSTHAGRNASRGHCAPVGTGMPRACMNVYSGESIGRG